MPRISGPAIWFAYDERKAGELAAHLIEFAGGSMPMLKLLKLIYLADRKSFVETGFPITGDSIVSMDMGPVPSETYDRLKPAGSLPFVSSEPGTVGLRTPLPAKGRLSDYEIEVASEVYATFGRMTGQQLTNYLHNNAPEWKAPTPGSSNSIDPASILRAAGRSEADIAAIASEAQYFRDVERRYVV